MRAAAFASVIGFAAIAVSACEFRTAADLEAELEAHYGKIGAVDDNLDPSESGAKVNVFNFEHIAAGLWRTTSSTDGHNDRQTRKRCYSHPQRADQTIELTSVASLLSSCKTLKMQNGGGYTIEHNCDNGETKLSGATTISGNLKTSYVIETRLAFRPRWRGMDRLSVTTVAERVGDC